eukprot:CAMPEP_0116140294 /NCGR_PEP_ID=MMETSP0329-20121206/13764_1 /TAXON_ID=697910 /ORGANISM="Pseudo-nitzschia arenysensis, Strain B593" /LENGTH=138 /DNA_ID=CAMNT_0003635385 /DNA_START=288 /DNA_END=704 /DNA_ORIENTATION=-
MDSADAAPPPKAPTLPSEATNANNTPICPTAMAANTPVTSQESVTATSTTTITKKRPLPGAKTAETTSATLEVPALKKKSLKEAPIKTKKTLKKKKKKKFSSILSGMMKPKKEMDLQAERESLRKSLGGGNFIKIDKI